MKFLNSNGSNLVRQLPPWRKYCKYIYYVIVILYLFSRNANAASEDLEGGEEEEARGGGPPAGSPPCPAGDPCTRRRGAAVGLASRPSPQ